MTRAQWQKVARATGELSTLAIQRMEALPWFTDLPAEQRSEVGLVVQAGLAQFVEWLRGGSGPDSYVPDVFGAAPREMTRTITLKQTVSLIRVVVAIVEQEVPSLVPAQAQPALEAQILRYSREIAFAAAEVYAAAAEAYGAWDARVEAGVVESLVRGQAGDFTLSRAATLGWGRPAWVLALACAAPDDPGLDARIANRARERGLSLLSGEVGGSRLLVLGGPLERRDAVAEVVAVLPDGPVVAGPEVQDLSAAPPSVAEALAGFAAVAAWPAAPRPVEAGALLAERVVLGEQEARNRLVDDVFVPLAAAGGDLLDTTVAYLDSGGSVEATARALYLHANTVRYRLRKIAGLLGLDLALPRDAQVVRLALTLGRAQL